MRSLTSSQFVRQRIARPWFGVLVSLALGGCVVGPDFERPAAPDVVSYLPASEVPAMAPGQGEPAQHLETGKTVPHDWWRIFQSPVLNDLLRRAMDTNPDIDAAAHTLAQAKQELREADAAYLPQVDAAASAERQKGPPLALGIRPDHQLPTYDLYTVGTAVSFTPDVFGLTARRAEQQKAQVDNRRYQLAALQLAVTGNVVDQALELGAATQQLAIARDLVATDERILMLERQRTAAGKVSTASVWSAQEQLDNDRAAVPPLQNQVSKARVALAVLLGQPPGEWKAVDLDLDEFVLPSALPVSLPSELVRQRPDILAAEARLHAANAAVGIADAQMYPQFTLSASIGTAALATETLGSGSSLVWTLMSGLTAPIFHGGALAAQKQAAIEHFSSERALYRTTVLHGLGEVADVLQSLGHDAQFAADRRGAWRSGQALQQLQRQRYDSGKVSQLDWLASTRDAQRAHLAYVQSAAKRYRDTADLIVALGGSWPADTPLDSCSQPDGQPTGSCHFSNQPPSP
jgi:NodT family efflux transporter outer membrane factor (OMF) lipoprotein